MLAEACFGLIGDAGSDRECEFIAETLEEGPLDLLPIAADAAHATGNLRLVQPMLRAWQHVDDRSKHVRIGLAISRLLEPPGGRIAQLAEKFTPDATERQNLIRRGGRYADLAEQHREEAPDFEVAVVTRYNELLNSIRNGDVPVARGADQPYTNARSNASVRARSKNGNAGWPIYSDAPQNRGDYGLEYVKLL